MLVKYQCVITKKNRDDSVLKKLEFEKRGLGNEHDDNNIKITELTKLLMRNDTTRLKQLVERELNDNIIPHVNVYDKQRLEVLKTFWFECGDKNDAYVICSFNCFDVDTAKFFMAHAR